LIRVSLRGLGGRKLRAALTAIAIVLGVAMVSGTYVLTDSIDQAFSSIFTDVRKGSNAVISGRAAFSLSDQSGATEPSFDESLLKKVLALPGVAAAEPSVNGQAQLIGKDGKAIVYGGAPNLGFSIANGDSRFNPLSLVDGAWPGTGEVVVDQSTAKKEGFKIGQVIGVQAEGPADQLRISGIVRFGSVATIGGATLAGFDLPTAQHLFEKPGKLDEIAVAAEPSVSDAELIRRIRSILLPHTQVKSSEAQAKADAKDTNAFISFLQKFLLAFAGISLFVGSFVIANSLSITIAQRTRELATLRTLGASRRQVLGSIVVEALLMGVAASLIGLFAGLGLAKLLFKLFDAVGFTLPNSGLIFETRTIVVALLVGILVTLVASLRPAFRATRVPPIAAVREGATLPESRFARFRTPGSLLLTGVGFAALAYGLFGHGLGTTKVLIWMGVGALLIFLGVALFSARVARPLAALVSPISTWGVVALAALFWPFFTLPFWLLRLGAWGPGGPWRRVLATIVGLVLNLGLALTILGAVFNLSPVLTVLGHELNLGLAGAVLNLGLASIVLAMWLRSATTSWAPEWPVDFPSVMPDSSANAIGSHNTKRNPQRTASTAAALMIGLALVTLVAVLARGITATFESAVNDIFTSDYAITAQNNYSPIPVSAGNAAAKAPGVETIASVRAGEARIFGATEAVTAVDPQVGSVLTLKWKEGSQAVLGTLGRNGGFVDDGYASDHHLRVGSPVPVLTPLGKHLDLVVKGIFKPPSGGSPFGPVTFSTTTFDASYQAPENLFTFVQMRGNVTAANTKALDNALARFPNAKAQTRKQFVDAQISGLKSVLNILYVLLALSVVVSLFGIVNTLVLTVFERTRELGMLRAIGMTRWQVRRMIRHESVITALIGAALGIALGIVLGGLLVARIDFIEFALPTFQLVVFAIAAVVVGIVAAIFPARRAARLGVLEALQYE
jgi:putative ABC transport system permease protein